MHFVSTFVRTTKTLILHKGKSDTALLQLIMQKDKQAFNEFYSRYADRCFVFLQKQMRNDDVGDDIFQDFWLRVWDNCDFLMPTGDSSVKKQLFRYLRYRVLDAYRNAEKNSALFNDIELEKDRQWYSHVIEELEVEDLYHLISDALKEEQPIIARIFWMRINQFSVEEIANSLSVSERTVIRKSAESMKLVHSHLQRQKIDTDINIGVRKRKTWSFHLF